MDATGSLIRSKASVLGVVPAVGGSSANSSITSSQWSASVGTTDYEVDLFGRIRSLNKEALEKYFSTIEARRSAQITLVAKVATQYFALRQAQEQIGLARQTLEAVKQSTFPLTNPPSPITVSVFWPSRQSASNEGRWSS